MSAFTDLLRMVHNSVNPYAGFPAKEWGGAWFNDPGARRDIFKQSIDMLQPRIIVEVGSFVGESAIFMAEHIKATGLDAAILCVDTWYAGFDHYVGAPEKIKLHFGRPDFYYRFMANVINHGHQDVILPLALDSINAARVLKMLHIKPNFVYVDASHEEGDVLRDYHAYWDLLDWGGGLLVDDLTGWFPGVVKDYTAFTKEFALKEALREGEKALVIKPRL